MVENFSENNCNFCKEAKLDIGDKTPYGAVIVYKTDGWFATLSHKTGGDPKKDFSIQLIPIDHLKYFSDIHKDLNLASNYGIAFAKLNHAISEIIKEQHIQESISLESLPIGTYGKCKHPDEHIHIKLFPYRNNIGQPFTVDSSFGRKEIHFNKVSGEEFVKLKPVRKVLLPEEQLSYLSKKLITLLS